MTTMQSTLKAPFPYFGGKSKVAPLAWKRFGDTANYIEPFAGSLAVLLSRPNWQGKTETVNDADCFLSNFWRAVGSEPDVVAEYADWPVNEADLHARHLWLVNQDEFRERMKREPDFYDVKIAGWWVWGISQWIGSGWCEVKAVNVRDLPHIGGTGRGVHRVTQKLPILQNTGAGVHANKVSQQIPALSSAGMGIHQTSQRLPSLGDAGRGIARPTLSRRIPHLSDAGTGVQFDERPCPETGISQYFDALCHRLRRVRVCCGDWSRIMGPSVTFKHGLTGVFLDPPYSLNERASVYAHESDCAQDVLKWCIENGDNPLLRIALCGYEGEHNELEGLGWDVVEWKANGGYGAVSDKRGKDNAHRERIWFNPHCLKPQQPRFEF